VAGEEEDMWGQDRDAKFSHMVLEILTCRRLLGKRLKFRNRF
jgi:hypothetical protein